MNIPMIASILGYVLGVEGLFMLPALAIGLFQKEWASCGAFAVTILLMALAFWLLTRKKAEKRDFYARDGLVAVGISWLLVSFFGALPYFFSRAIPNFVDCLFETVSGFTTTGASILTDIESLPMSILYWRSFTHWLGGMGVLVFLLAIRGDEGGGTLHLLRAESPGVQVGKMVPRMRRNSMILYTIYVAMTVIMFLLLLVDMPAFDAITTTFGTAGTGGFAIRNDSMASYSLYSHIVITVFTVLFGVNFSVYYLMLLGRFRSILHNEELWWYLGIFFAASLAIAVNIMPMYGSFGSGFHNASFTVATIMSTTGFGITNTDLWPEFSKVILLLLMFIGASAGSTGGGLKVVRVILLGKIIRRGSRRMMFPNEVKRIHLDGEPQEKSLIDACSVFILIYAVLTMLFTLLLSLEGKDFTTTFSSVAACLNNVGPGFGEVGTTMNYACYSWYGKILLSLAMLFGRLEIFPMLVLFLPDTWKK